MTSRRLPRSGRNVGLLCAAGALAVATLAGCTPLPGGPSASGTAAPPGTDVMNVADAAIAGNDPAMALKVSQSVLANDPHNLDALYHEGAAYYAVGRCEDAVAAYKVALTVDPKSSEAETGIGRCLLKRNAAEAELAFDAAVADDPSDAAALNDLGIARDLQGKYAAATQPYEQALLIEPGTLSTEVNLGMSLALSGDSQDALQYLGPLATGQDATPKIREDYAAALVAAGRTDQARQILSIDLAPDQVAQILNVFAEAIASAQTTPGGAAAGSVAANQPVNATAAVTPVTAAPVMSTPVAADSPENTAPPAVTPAPAPQTAPPPAAAQLFSPESGPGDQLVR